MTTNADHLSDEDQDSLWQQAVQVAVLLAIDPGTLGGVRLRASAGLVRDAWLNLLRSLMSPSRWVRMPISITDERLLGGLDLSATLATGRPVLQPGLLAEADGGTLILSMAERLPTATAARLTQVMDERAVVLERDGLAERRATRFAVVALDEGLSEEESLSPALRDRLAFELDLRPISPRRVNDIDMQQMMAGSIDDIVAAREALAGVEVPDEVLKVLCGTALVLGVDSMRASIMARAVACASAALMGNQTVSDDDARLAATLVLSPRATRMPPAPEQEQEEQPEEQPPEEPQEQPMDDAPPNDPDDNKDDQDDQQDDQDDQTSPPDPSENKAMEDRVLDAAKAAIPAGLLSQLIAGSLQQRASSGKSGAMVKGGQRGRPSGSRRAQPAHGSRLHLIDTLSAAAPWQKIRKATLGPEAQQRVQVRSDDFHIARIKQKTATTTLFVVDASGSSALHRLAEAKGAVELLLADCYVRRDQVALIAFRGKVAELLLPPTRSLVRAKRSLSGLPGGGGTPLATAIDTAASVAEGLRRRGQSPVVVLLTDGRANVARDGTGGRERAQAEATQAARQLAALQVPLLFIDTSPKPQELAAQLAGAMRARYIPLPHAGAAAVSLAVRAATQNGSR
jgi:magnesium chelatase subunit D